MPSIRPEQLPAGPRRAWLALRDELKRILGEDLVAVWAYGGTANPSAAAHNGDLDTYVLISHAPNDSIARALEAAQSAVAHRHGVEFDMWFVLERDARRREAPHHAFHHERRDTSWAINRAHWLAGRYVAVWGPEPSELVPSPTWPELEADLDRELEHIERHVIEGDDDSYEAAYALLNGSRILRAAETRDVAISKAAAGEWGLGHLPGRWHPALHAALRCYTGSGTAEDARLIAAEMGPFVAYVRERVPAVGRAADTAPRWSGY